MEARVVSAFDATGLSRDEVRGVLKMREDLAHFLARRPDARWEFVWRWHGNKLHCVKVVDATELMEE